ncbi:MULTISPECIES: hypothetical protein [unclassified Rhizobium]|uniref:hypothetical protein n=1 Tax=unclassified Rhizobium TaxID=2613769 RepID=UPI00160B9B0C|nr:MULTISPECIES: hypothetical protein [unclassified Rhizobium]MBB3288139.1 hypothetical protein [Rhizobium sp. BK252]MBB3402997.1 hypothetical protein [Rhizobium sp. BK289]MBB3415574.1 hypothetical protein [Rhizobium sp. BK284]MBB3483345.1 hypothetical protein [Rhizobium sp. BK347]
MFVEWKFDVIDVSSSAAGPELKDLVPFAMPSQNVGPRKFESRFRSVDRSTFVLDSSLILEMARNATYVGLFGALSKLHALDDEDPAAIDAETFNKANIVLSLLASKAAEPPQIFSHGGDAAVFSWGDSDGVKYITVSGDCAVFARRDRGSKPVTVGVADMSESNAAELLPYVGVIRDGSSTNPIR